MELDSKNSLGSSFSRLDNIISPAKSRNTLVDVSPESPPVSSSRFTGSRMTVSMDPRKASKAFTKLDLDNYKFNRNKKNYSRATQNIKIMRKNLFSDDVVK